MTASTRDPEQTQVSPVLEQRSVRVLESLSLSHLYADKLHGLPISTTEDSSTDSWGCYLSRHNSARGRRNTLRLQLFRITHTPLTEVEAAVHEAQLVEFQRDDMHTHVHAEESFVETATILPGFGWVVLFGWDFSCCLIVFFFIFSSFLPRNGGNYNIGQNFSNAYFLHVWHINKNHTTQ